MSESTQHYFVKAEAMEFARGWLKREDYQSQETRYRDLGLLIDFLEDLFGEPYLDRRGPRAPLDTAAIERAYRELHESRKQVGAS